MGGVNKKEWIKTVIGRFSNPAIKDTILRLTEDATNRIGVALAPCLHADAVNGKSPLSPADTEAIMLPVACWVRCLVGDAVQPFPAAAKLNKDDNEAKVKVPAQKLWNAADAESAKTFLRTAFTEQAATDKNGAILAAQVKTLSSDGVEKALAGISTGGGDTTCCSACTIS